MYATGAENAVDFEDRENWIHIETSKKGMEN